MNKKKEHITKTGKSKKFSLVLLVFLLLIGFLIFLMQSGNLNYFSKNESLTEQAKLPTITTTPPIISNNLATNNDEEISNLYDIVHQLSSRITRLEERIALMQDYTQNNPATSSSNNYTALILVLNNLQNKLLAGKAFTNELSAAFNIANNNALISNKLHRLEAYSANGVKSTDRLLTELNSLKKAVHKQYLIEKKDESISNKIEASLANIITIRKLQNNDEDNPNVIIQRAQQALEQDNVKQAVEIIQTLPTNHKVELQSWLKGATEYLFAKATIDEIFDDMNTIILSSPEL
jgi:hypothetical protein